MVVKMLGGGPNGDWEKKARRAYFETPVVTTERFQAIVELLNVFAQYLADNASRCAIANSHEEPTVVVSAKAFVHFHAEEPVTLAQVAQHVHVSPFYFCKLFKKATGMTLTEYVARVRVEKAKTLLVDPSLRISEVVYAAGLGSIRVSTACLSDTSGCRRRSIGPRCALRWPCKPTGDAHILPPFRPTANSDKRMPSGK